jgi:Cu2+-exporting ATPase
MSNSLNAPGAALSATQVAALDETRAVDAITQWTDGADGSRVGHSRLLISGMHCAACSGLIEAALLGVDGVRSAEASGATERAVVSWDAGRTRLSALVEAVRRAGYGAYPDTGAEALNQAKLESRQAVWRLFVAGICMMQVMMYATPAYVATSGDMSPDMLMLLRWASWVLSIPVLVFAAGPYFKSAWNALRQRRIGMDVPVSLGILVTFIAGSQSTFCGQGDVYFDSLTMFVAVLLAARLLETRARRRAAQALDALMRRLPDTVERLCADGRTELVSPSALLIGDRVRVQVGQAFAADGVVLEGQTQVDEAALTGESTPVERGVGDPVSAGCLNLGAPTLMRVDQLGAQTRYQRIVALVERALTERPAFVLATDRLAGPFLWAVILLAGGAWLAWQWIDPARATWVAVSVLIVTCPCALSIGAPVALIAAAGQLARRGVLVQKLDALEALTRVDTVVFDKTGTLTEDRLVPADMVRLGVSAAHDGPIGAAAGPATPGAELIAGQAHLPDQRQLDSHRQLTNHDLLALAASLGDHSRHPLARALAQAHGKAGDAAVTSATGADDSVAALPLWLEVIEQPGAGLQARLNLLGEKDDPDHCAGAIWRLGSAAWCGVVEVVEGAAGQQAARPAVWLARLDGEAWQPHARFEFDEVLRPDAGAAVRTLQQRGLKVQVLSGDQPASVAALLSRLLPGNHNQQATRHGTIASGISPAASDAVTWRALCTPQDKLDELEALQAAGRHVLMVGDGINDAPVLARADVSVAMGSAAALAQARADVVVLSNRIQDITELHRGAARCVAVVRQNLSWAVAYNIACVPLALAGWLPPWAAGLGMAGSSLLVVLNALRLTRGQHGDAPRPATPAYSVAAALTAPVATTLPTGLGAPQRPDVMAARFTQR